MTERRALDKQTGQVLRAKHDKERTVPLSPRIVEAFAKLPRRGLWIVCRPDGCALNYDEVNHAVTRSTLGRKSRVL